LPSQNSFPSAFNEERSPQDLLERILQLLAGDLAELLPDGLTFPSEDAVSVI